VNDLGAHEGRVRLARVGSPYRVDIRTPLVYRILFFLMAGGIGGFGLILLAYSISERRPAGFVVVSMFLAVAWIAWRFATARLTLQQGMFVVRSLFKTSRISLDEVDRFEVGDDAYWGVQLIPRESFATIKVSVIQKGSWAWAPMTSRRTKADRLIDQLNDIVRASRPQDRAKGDLPPAPEP